MHRMDSTWSKEKKTIILKADGGSSANSAGAAAAGAKLMKRALPDVSLSVTQPRVLSLSTSSKKPKHSKLSIRDAAVKIAEQREEKLAANHVAMDDLGPIIKWNITERNM